MIDAQVAGDHTRALRIHLELTPLMKALFMTSNPIMVKKALELQGFPVGGVRLPLIEATPEQTAELERVMRDGVLAKRARVPRTDASAAHLIRANPPPYQRRLCTTKNCTIRCDQTSRIRG